MSKLSECALLSLLLVACTRKEPAHQVESASTSTATRPAASVRPASDGATEGNDKSPLPLVLQVEKSAGGVGLHVLQQGPEPLSLAGAVLIERVGGERLEQALTLRNACKQEGCVKLSAGGELLAPPWLGMVEGERCDPLFVPKSAGEHVITVRSCDGTRSAEVRFVWNGP